MALASAELVVNTAWNAALHPPQALTVSEWADSKRKLSTSTSPEPGDWHTSRTPYLRQIMDSLSPMSPARTITFMKGSQVGGTEASLNWVGYVVDHSPASMLVVLPTMDTAKEWSKHRLTQLTEDTEALRGKILESRRRDSGNTALAKRFPGGFLKIAWSSSASKLRSTPAAYVLADEVDGFEGDTDEEGDPIALLERRFTNYPRGKMLMISTPTVDATSRIQREFRKGDQRYFFVPCPNCQHYQRLIFGNLKWEKGQPYTVAYECIGCHELIQEREKTRLLAEGIWVATMSDPQLAETGFSAADLSSLDPIFEAMAQSKVPSFHLSALYSPAGWYSWVAVATDWEAAQGNQERMKVFVNTVLGETWRERGQAPNWKRLFDRTDLTFSLRHVPQEALVLTAGVDVQPDRLELHVLGHGRRRRAWTVDYRILEGSTEHIDVWNELDAVLAERYSHAGGKDLSIRKVAVDTGYKAPYVYEWSRRHRYSPIIALVKGGSDNSQIPVGMPNAVEYTANGKRIMSGLKVSVLNVGHFKHELYGRLDLELPNWQKGESFPDGWYAWPEMADTEEFCKQITAEQLITRTHKGFAKREWVKVRPRNEVLDTWVYAMAAAVMLGVPRFEERHWAELESHLRMETIVVRPELQAPPSMLSSQPSQNVRTSGGRTIISPSHKFGRDTW